MSWLKALKRGNLNYKGDLTKSLESDGRIIIIFFFRWKNYDVTVSLRNTKATSAYFLEGKQIIETFFLKGLYK